MLDLTLQITADAAQAKAALRDVENGIQRVDAAAQKSSTNQATWWQKEEKAIEKVTGTLTTHRGEVSKVEQAFAKAEAAVTAAERSSAKLGSTTTQTTAALSGMRTGTTDVSSALLGMVGAGNLSVGMLGAVAAGVGLVVGAAAALVSVLAQSVQHYIQHSKAAAGVRSEIERLSQTWDDFQMLVGTAVMGGEDAPLISFLRLAQHWAMQLGLKLAGDILLVKELANAVPGVDFLRGVLNNADPGALPDPSKVLGGAHPLGSYFGWVAGGAGALQLPSAGTAERLFAQDEAERKRQEQERRRRAEEYLRQQEAIKRAFESGPGYRLGLSGQIGTMYDIAPPSGVPSLTYRLGLTGDLPEAISVREMLAGVTRTGRPNPFAQEFLSPYFAGSLGSALMGPNKFSGVSNVVGGSLIQALSRTPRGSSGAGQMGGALAGLGLQIAGSSDSMAASVGGMAMTGAGIGTMIFPGVGTAIGAGIGAVVGFAKKAFSETQGHKDLVAGNKAIAEMKAGLIGQYGSTRGAQDVGRMFGVDLAGGWGHQNIQGAMAFQDMLEELSKRQAKFNTNLGDTLAKIEEFGGNVPEALRPYLSQLEDAKVLTEDNLALIERMSKEAVPSYQQMEAAAKRLGISTDALGQSFQNAKAAANWQSVIDDLDLLIRGGSDLNALLGDEGLQKKFNDLVQQSLQFGTKIPENMRPWIQKLIDSGKLLGLNQEAITDIGKLSFGDTMQTSLEKLNDTLKELIDTLRIALPAAAKEGADGVRREFDNLPVPGTGRTGNPNRPPSEVPESDGGGRPSASRGFPVVLQVDGRTLGHAMAPYMPGVNKTYVGRS